MPEIYLSYLFRYWQCGNKDNLDCRITLENPHTREITAFNDLEECMAHLQEQINQRLRETGSFQPSSSIKIKGENQ